MNVEPNDSHKDSNQDSKASHINTTDQSALSSTNSPADPIAKSAIPNHSPAESTKDSTVNPTPIESETPLPPDTVRLAIKCPSLYQDPELINVTKQTTVGQIKTLVNGTWPGRPSLDGMRCISAGRLLKDEDVVGDFAAATDSEIPTASLHLVIRPDAWTTPPQFPASLISGGSVPRQSSNPGTPADVLAGSSYFGPPAPNPNLTQIPPQIATSASSSSTSSLGINTNLGASALLSPAVATPSNPSQATPPSIPTFSFSLSPSTPSATLPNATHHAEHAVLSPEKRLAKLLEKLPAQQYDLVKEMLLVGHACYLDRYRKIWAELYPDFTEKEEDGDQNKVSGEGSELDPEKQISLRVLERDILDWPELPLSVSSEDGEKQEATYIYQQVSLEGLPYLMRVESTPWLQECSSLLHELYSRLCILQRLCVKMDRMIGYSRMGSILTSRGAAGLAAATLGSPQQRQLYMSLDPQARAQAMQGLESLQRRIAAATGLPVPAAVNPAAASTRLTSLQRETARRRTRRIFPHPADLGNIFAPVLFLLFKVTILLYVVSRNASPLKKHFLALTGAVYIFYQANLLLKRQRRLRHAAERARRLAANGGDPGDRLARRMAQRRAAPQGANAAHRPVAPAANGATPNPSSLPSQSRGATTSPEDPFAPPQPLYAPVRHRASSPSTLQWWSEQIAYAGLAREDMQLGLLPPRPAPSSNNNAARNQERSILQIIFPFAFPDQNQARQHPPSALGPLDFLPTFLLALLLFVGTLSPHIELMRRKAIEERENVIRVAARKEEERRERREELERLRKEEAEKRLEEEQSSARNAESGQASSQEKANGEGGKDHIESKDGNSAGAIQSAADAQSSASQLQSQGLPGSSSTPSQSLASEYSERVLRGQTLAGGIRPGAELDLDAEHEAARRAAAGEIDGEAATDDTDGADDADGEVDAGVEEDMGFF